MKSWLSWLTLPTFVELVILICLPTILLGWWHTAPENGFLYDDAFISFRYSVNVANGYGLVWNPGGEPTQGYTNFLFVLVPALAYRFGISPVYTAHVLNWFGIMMTSLAGYAMARALLVRPFLRVLPALLMACFPTVLANALTGMETVFWIGLVIVAAALAQWYIHHPQRALLVAHTVVSFLGCLTRPESVLFAGLWFAILLIAARQHRREVVIAICGFGLVGLLYIVWLQFYFGAVLPNSFYVKVGDTDRMPGLPYVQEFISQQLEPFGGVWLGLLGLLTLTARWKRLIAHLAVTSVVLTLLVFYQYAFPLMGLYYRFVLPVACVLLGWLALGWIAALDQPLNWAERRLLNRRNSNIVPIMRLVLMLTSIFVVWQPLAGIVAHAVAHPMSAGTLFYANKRMGEAIATLPEAPNILIAYNDVGILPYVSRANNLDTVGLNDNQIARKGKREGFLWVVGYIFNAHPDVIGFYTFRDGTVYIYGHGVIGGYYNVLAGADYFKQNYTYVGGFDADWVIIQWFVYNQSPYRRQIQQVVGQAADFTEYTIKMP